MLNIKSIKELIKAYSDGSLPVEEFCGQYTKLFAAIEAEEIDDKLFHILEDLFEDIDAYSPMWTAQDEAEFPYRIIEATLRSEAQKSLHDLEEYISSHQSTKKKKPN